MIVVSDTSCISNLLTVQADGLLIDEAMGRKIAQREGLHVTGVLGVLLAAKHRGLITTVRPLMLRLRTEAGFHISPALYHEFLAAAGESP